MRDPRPSAQRGFAIVSAIFLLVVLGALGAFMVTLSTVQHTTSTQDMQGARAYQAARAGIEWGAYQVLTPEHANPVGVPYVCPVAATALNTLAGSLAGFSVTVLCELTAIYGRCQSDPCLSDHLHRHIRDGRQCLLRRAAIVGRDQHLPAAGRQYALRELRNAIRESEPLRNSSGADFSVYLLGV